MEYVSKVYGTSIKCNLKLSGRCLGFIVFFCGTAGTDRTRQVSIKSYTAGWCPVGDHRCQECACRVSGKYMGCAELVRKRFGICLEGVWKGSLKGLKGVGKLSRS